MIIAYSYMYASEYMHVTYITIYLTINESYRCVTRRLVTDCVVLFRGPLTI